MASKNPVPDLLKQAILSILRQSLREFELIIVDDGSDEPIEFIIRSFTNDSRIKNFRIKNSGLGAALNYGISKSSGKYIARLDDDDMMCPDRLEKQYQYLENNEDCSCVGTWHYDLVGNRYYPHRKYPCNHNSIVLQLIEGRFSMAHTSIMFRRESFDKIGGYRISGGGQDLDLFLQLSTVGLLANLPFYLTYYTMSETGLSQINPKKKEAYLFAYKSLLEGNNYPELSSLLKKRISDLEISVNQEENSNNKGFRKSGRWLLVMRVKLFGKKYKDIIF